MSRERENPNRATRPSRVLDSIEQHPLWPHLVPSRPYLVPEVALVLLPSSSQAWQWTEPEALGWPYWAFAWAGGQALARYLLEHPERVKGRRVLSFGAGGGLEAIASARAGATTVLCADLDPLACEMAHRNAALNHLQVHCTTDNLLGRDVDADVLLVGDTCYEEALAAQVLTWLEEQALRGLDVLVGDPGRVALAAWPTPVDGAPLSPSQPLLPPTWIWSL